MIPVIPAGRPRSPYITWKGDKLTYTRLHARVYELRGKPQHCEQCGTTDPDKRYEWANLTGRYEDTDDYRRMCKSCHRRYDLAGHIGSDLSVKEAAARLCCSRQKILTLIWAGRIAARRINPGTQGTWRISQQAFADYLARRAS
jgi:excisionase family DNA binding protein